MDAATPLYGLSDPIDGGVLRQAQTDLAAVPDGRQADSALDLIMSAPYDERYNRRLAQFFSLPQKQSRSKESIAMWAYYCEQTLRRQREASVAARRWRPIRACNTFCLPTAARPSRTS